MNLLKKELKYTDFLSIILVRNATHFPEKNKTYKELLKKIKAENIDYFVINTRFQLPSLIGAKIAKEQGKQAIFTEHGTTYLTINSKFFDKILHIIEKLLIAQVKKNSKIFYGVSQEAAN